MALLAVVAIVVVFAATAVSTRCESTNGTKPPPDRKLPTVQEMIDARTDVWGDASMKQPNGASYEFFQDLLPPLRWVNAEFRHYPIELSAPCAPQKVRLVSNGSAVNALANKPPMWFEQGVPVKFSVGDPDEPFGESLRACKRQLTSMATCPW